MCDLISQFRKFSFLFLYIFNFFVSIDAITIDTQLGIADQDCFERVALGWFLPPSDVYENRTQLGVMDCEKVCLDDERCQSFDYGVGAKGNSTCHLSMTRAEDLMKINSTVRSLDYDLYSRRLRCEQSPPSPLAPLQDDPIFQDYPTGPGGLELAPKPTPNKPPPSSSSKPNGQYSVGGYGYNNDNEKPTQSYQDPIPNNPYNNNVRPNSDKPNNQRPNNQPNKRPNLNDKPNSYQNPVIDNERPDDYEKPWNDGPDSPGGYGPKPPANLRPQMDARPPKRPHLDRPNNNQNRPNFNYVIYDDPSVNHYQNDHVHFRPDIHTNRPYIHKPGFQNDDQRPDATKPGSGYFMNDMSDNYGPKPGEPHRPPNKPLDDHRPYGRPPSNNYGGNTDNINRPLNDRPNSNYGSQTNRPGSYGNNDVRPEKPIYDDRPPNNDYYKPLNKPIAIYDSGPSTNDRPGTGYGPTSNYNDRPFNKPGNNYRPDDRPFNDPYGNRPNDRPHFDSGYNRPKPNYDNGTRPSYDSGYGPTHSYNPPVIQVQIYKPDSDYRPTKRPLFDYEKPKPGYGNQNQFDKPPGNSPGYGGSNYQNDRPNDSFKPGGYGNENYRPNHDTGYGNQNSKPNFDNGYNNQNQRPKPVQYGQPDLELTVINYNPDFGTGYGGQGFRPKPDGNRPNDRPKPQFDEPNLRPKPELHDPNYRPGDPLKPVYEYEKPVGQRPQYMQRPDGTVVSSGSVMVDFHKPGGTGSITELKPTIDSCYRRVLAGRRALRSHVLRVLPLETLQNCKRECADEVRFHCESFNYRLDPASRGKGLCELMTKPVQHLNLRRDFVDDPEYDFYELDRNSLQPDCALTWPPPPQPYPPYSSGYGGRPYPERPPSYRPEHQSGNGYYKRDHNYGIQPYRPDPYYDIKRYDNFYTQRYNYRPQYRPYLPNRSREGDDNYIPYEIASGRSDEDQASWGKYGGSYGGYQNYYHNRNEYKNTFDYWGLSNYAHAQRYPLNYGVKPHGSGYDRSFDYNSLGGNRWQGDTWNYYGYGYGGPKPRYDQWNQSVFGDYEGALVNFGYKRPSFAESRFGTDDLEDVNYWDDYRPQAHADCSSRRRSGMRLDGRAVRRELAVPGLLDCEEACYRESTFKCVSYSFRYSKSPTPNCFLSEVPYQGLELATDSGSDVFAMGEGHHCGASARKPWAETECFWHVRAGRKLSNHAVRLGLSASGLGACEAECIRAQSFVCRAFSFRFGAPVIGDEPENCLLTSLSNSELSDTWNSLEASEGHELYARGSFGRGCEPTVIEESMEREEKEENCYLQYDTSARLLPAVTRAKFRADDERGCSQVCDSLRSEAEGWHGRYRRSIPHREAGQFRCMSFSFNSDLPENQGENCLLSDIKLNDLQLSADYEHSKHDWLFAYDIFNKQCRQRVMVPQPIPRPHIHGKPGYEEADVHYSPELPRPIRPPPPRHPPVVPEVSIPYPGPSTVPSVEFRPHGPSSTVPPPFYDDDRPDFEGPPAYHSGTVRPIDPGPAAPDYRPSGFDREYDFYEDGGAEAWSHYTVSGLPCRAGTSCAPNHVAGHWSCEPEGGEVGSWDYCCAPHHRCGYSEGFAKPWCYVGPEGDQWRPCTEKYYPYHQHSHPPPGISKPPHHQHQPPPNAGRPSHGHHHHQGEGYLPESESRPFYGDRPGPGDRRPGYLPHRHPYLPEEDRKYWDDLYQNGPQSFYDEYGNPRPGYVRVPMVEKHRIKYHHNYGPSRPSDPTWVPVSGFSNEGLPPPRPGGFGTARYWPVAYLHKNPPPNTTYYQSRNELNPPPPPNRRSDNEDGKVLHDKERPKPMQPKPDFNKMNDRSDEERNPKKVSNDNDNNNVKNEIPKNRTRTVIINTSPKENTSKVAKEKEKETKNEKGLEKEQEKEQEPEGEQGQEQKQEKEKEKREENKPPKTPNVTIVKEETAKSDIIDVNFPKPKNKSTYFLDDKLDPFLSENIEIIDLEDEKEKKERKSNIELIESEERQIEAIGRILASRRDGKLGLGKRAQNLESKNIKISYDLNEDSKFLSTPRTILERRGIVQRVSKDYVKSILNNNTNKDNERRKFVDNEYKLDDDNKEDVVKKKLVNGELFYDATMEDDDDKKQNVKEEREVRLGKNIQWVPTTLIPQEGSADYTPLDNSEVFGQRMAKARRKRVKSNKDRYNPEEVRRRLLEREKSREEIN